MNKEFGFKEVLLRYQENKDAEFTQNSNKEKESIVEVEILALGKDSKGFYNIGDKVLIHKGSLIERKHKYFSSDERMIDNEMQIICRVKEQD